MRRMIPCPQRTPPVHSDETQSACNRRRTPIIIISCFVVIATIISVALTRPSSDFILPQTEPPPPRFVNQSGVFGLSYVFGEPPSDLREEFEKSFERASLFWSGVIHNDLETIVMADRPDVTEMSFCGDRTLLDTWFKLPTTIEGIQVGVRVMDVDGMGGTLALTTPCAFEPINNITSGISVRSRGGVMVFDTADIKALLADNNLDAVVAHELAHVLGFGTLWRFSHLTTGYGTEDPRYEGAGGIAGFEQLLVEADMDVNSNLSVPIENQGGRGTASVHWRASTFKNELMTGYLKSNEAPVSIMTIESLQDLGFSVNESAAEEYLLPVVDADVFDAVRMKAAVEGEEIDLSGDVLELDIGRIWNERKARMKKNYLRALSDSDD